MNIVVLGGGLSSERHVSLVTSNSVCKALRKNGHNAIFVDSYLGLEDYQKPLSEIWDEEDGLCKDTTILDKEPDLEEVRKSRKQISSSKIGKHVLEVCAMADIVFLGLHGEDGEDGRIQAMFDLLGIHYTGSGMLGSAMAMDKSVTKMVMEDKGVRTPKWSEYRFNEADIPKIIDETNCPCVVKAVTGGSSIGTIVVDKEDELENALRKVLAISNHMIIEEKIEGREFTIPILGKESLAAIEIIPPESGVFDYVAKYQNGNIGAKEICPADITEEEYNQMASMAVTLYEALNLSVYSRADFILDNDGKAWCLEINTLPGMTANSLFPKAAKHANISYEELCETIIKLSKTEKA